MKITTIESWTKLNSFARLKTIVVCLLLGHLLMLNVWAAPVPSEKQKIQVNGKVTVHIRYHSLPVKAPIGVQIYHVFPAYDFSQDYKIISRSEGSMWLQLPVRTPQDGLLQIGDLGITHIFMIPGDTIAIDVQKTDRLQLSFKGKLKAVQEYYVARDRRFPIEYGQLLGDAGSRTKNLADFKIYHDSLSNVMNQFWHQYSLKHTLPAWFNRFESDAIRYTDAWSLYRAILYQFKEQHITQSLPEGYLASLKAIPIYNKEAQYDYVYLRFLDDHINYQAKALKDAQPGTHYRVALNTVINTTLGDDLGSFYRIIQASGSAKDDPEVARTSLGELVYPIHYQYLISYLLTRSAAKYKLLFKNDLAPQFMLKDTQDSLISLNQFKGNIVYISFWFAGCASCIPEFPYENQLVDTFAGQRVKIVSICTSTEYARWQETIQRVGLKTVNLFADSYWKTRLEANYGISVYPRYVLIGADGKIIENFATYPSNGAHKKIQAALDELAVIKK